MSNSTIEKQIDNYLSLLSPLQKETVLSVVKTIAMASQEYDSIWENKTFAGDVDTRTASYENGTAKLYKFEEMKKVAVSNYKEKVGHKK